VLHKSSLTYFHVFPYSKRQGTIAASMDNQIKPEITKERSKILRDLGNKKKLNFYNKFIGKKLEILVEKDFKGTSRNYIPVFIRENNVFRGQIIDAVVTEVNENSVVCNTISH
jgi:threonylcarbamoyladenosine tRNA methylthiotransferase MtaB